MKFINVERMELATGCHLPSHLADCKYKVVFCILHKWSIFYTLHYHTQVVFLYIQIILFLFSIYSFSSLCILEIK